MLLRVVSWIVFVFQQPARPFRHIRYDNSLMGATELRNRVREFFRSLTEDGLLSSIGAQMEKKWAKADHNFIS